MKKIINFDHLVGEENSQLSEKDLKTFRRIVKAHSEEQSVEDKQIIGHISLRLEMEDYTGSTNK